MKLYVVTISREAYVLADSKEEALALQGEIERWEDYPSVDAMLADSATLCGWDDTSLVYHHGSGDITLKKARQLVAKDGK